MGVIVPITLFVLLHLTLTEALIVFATTFLAWGVTDLFSTILEKPRLHGRSPGKALREDWERRSKD
jgi:VIT1/CCC1 family predicted Fe2+/Mn2+ transporter